MAVVINMAKVPPVSDYERIYQTLIDQNKVLGEIQGTVDSMRKELLGNGQPGRMAEAEDRITEIEEHMNKSIGYFMGISAIVSILIAGLMARFHEAIASLFGK